jgi:hypothetical protein
MPLTPRRFARRRQASETESAPAPGDGGGRHLSEGFFDRHPRFFATSTTSARPWRLNLRHEAIFTEHRQVIAGASVLDIASHDGRWSLAALESGATSVLGIEARPELVALAEANLGEAGVDPGRFRFVADDVFEVLARGDIDVDVVMCLGFLYHTLRYNELWTRIRECRPRHVLIDTLIRPDHEEPIVKLFLEPTSREGNAVNDAYSTEDHVLVGQPSLSALRLMGKAHGFELTALSDWAGLLRDNPEADGVGDYRKGKRITALFSGTDLG